jgi:hypothetical protein
MQLLFPTPPKRFKKVKSVRVRVLHDADASNVFDHPITVYMDMSGSPEFVVFVPDQYAAEWDLHGDSERAGFYVHNAKESDVPRAVRALTFDQAVDRLEKVSYLFAEKVRSRSLKKVIGIGLEAITPHHDGQPGIRHEPPSFSKSELLVGVRSGIHFEVNGKLYTAGYKFDENTPDFNELNPDSRTHYHKIIPYTDEAWSTILRVEDALRNAATMLHSLITSDQCELLLKNGLQGLLAAPANTTSPQGE